MNLQNRFRDENIVLSNFYKEVLVVCKICAQKAIAIANFKTKTARLFCLHCGYNKEISTAINYNLNIEIPANHYFQSVLWLQATFKKEIFWAYNEMHLEYLERYISATLREHNDRSHFTLLEKLPKFYHEAKNRESLLKIISKLK